MDLALARERVWPIFLNDKKVRREPETPRDCRGQMDWSFFQLTADDRCYTVLTLLSFIEAHEKMVEGEGGCDPE